MGLADRHYQRYDDGNPPRHQWQMQGFSPTVGLIILHCLFFVLCIFGTPSIERGLGSYFFVDKPNIFNQYELWRLASYFIAETRPFNLIFNMMALYFMGRILEIIWTWRKLYLSYVLFAVAGAVTALPVLYFFTLDPKNALLFGASAPVMGIIVASTFRFQDLQGRLPFADIPISPKIFLGIIIAAQVFFTLIGLSSILALAASTGGGLAGYLWVTFVKEKGRVTTGKQSWFSRFMAQRRQKKREKEAADLAALQTEVDRILDKVRQHGLHSLTEAEKRSLKRATDLQNQKPTRL